MYGPGFWDDIKGVVKPIATGALVVVSVFPPKAPIAAPVAGAAVKTTAHLSDDDNAKEFGNDLLDVASDSASGQKIMGDAGYAKKVWPA